MSNLLTENYVGEMTKIIQNKELIDVDLKIDAYYKGGIFRRIGDDPISKLVVGFRVDLDTKLVQRMKFFYVFCIQARWTCLDQIPLIKPVR